MIHAAKPASHKSPRHMSRGPPGAVPYARWNMRCMARVNESVASVRITMLTQVTALSTSPELLNS